MAESQGSQMFLSCMPGTARDRDRDLGDRGEWGKARSEKSLPGSPHQTSYTTLSPKLHKFIIPYPIHEIVLK